MNGNAETRVGGVWSFLRIAGWGFAALALLTPLVAMQFTDEVDWSVGDFIFASVLLGGTGGLLEFAVRKTSDGAYRAAFGIALSAAFVLIWINGAVGIIGDSNSDANMMFLGVLAVGAIGALVARVRAYGMALALYATALAQVLVAVIAVSVGLGDKPLWPWDFFAITAFFVALWVGSALLFGKAARRRREWREA